jgi:hypothetical protein
MWIDLRQKTACAQDAQWAITPRVEIAQHCTSGQVIESGIGESILDMAEMTCNGCGSKKRVQQLPHGPRIINHSRPGAPDLVKEQRDARVVLQIPEGTVLGDEPGAPPLEERIVAYKDLALVTVDTDLQRAAIYDAALALIEAAHRGEGTIGEPVMVEVTVERPTIEACPGSGQKPRSE